MNTVDQETIDRIFSMITKFPEHRCVELINMCLGDVLEHMGVSIAADGNNAVVTVASMGDCKAILPQFELMATIKTLGNIYAQLTNTD